MAYSFLAGSIGHTWEHTACSRAKKKKNRTHDGAAPDDADEDNESVIVEVFAKHEHVGIRVVFLAIAAVAWNVKNKDNGDQVK